MKDITDTVNDVCMVRQCMGYNYIHAVGYRFYGTLLLRSRYCIPLQIRAHQHINVYTDINNLTVNYIRLRWTKV